MLKLFKRVWGWIRGFLAGLLGANSPRLARGNRPRRDDREALSDTDYEFLFSQLLEGVAHGWHEGRILKFFNQLGERGKAKLWVSWLERFGNKLLASPAPNLQLAARMISLGELAQSFPAIRPIGQASYTIGRQLYAREADSTVWEYEGPDLEVSVTASPLETEAATGKDSTPVPPLGEEGVVTLTIEELLARLQQDEALAAQMAQQLGMENTDPQGIVEALVSQFQATQSQLDNQPPPTTVEGWFQRGLQQANVGDLEGAIASWDQALSLNPNLPQAWYNRGSVLGNLGKMEEAMASFDRALELNPDDYQVWNAKGNAWYDLQNWHEAIACWDRVLQLQPEAYQTWSNRGSALEHLGQIGEAISCYQQALAIEPNFELAKAKLQELADG